VDDVIVEADDVVLEADGVVLKADDVVLKADGVVLVMSLCTNQPVYCLVSIAAFRAAKYTN
jgi:hypothetical protein